MKLEIPHKDNEKLSRFIDTLPQFQIVDYCELWKRNNYESISLCSRIEKMREALNSLREQYQIQTSIPKTFFENGNR